jgi:hypothetical protein
MDEQFENRGVGMLRPDRDSLAESIDPASLERLGRIARGLPGHTISLNQHPSAPPQTTRVLDDVAVLRIDGIAATEFVARYEGESTS